MKTLRPFVLALAASSLIAVGARADTLKGHISSVDSDARTLVVTDPSSGKDIDVTVNDQTVIRSASGKVLKVDDLKQGDGVGIAHTRGVASEIVVNAKADELTGHVKLVAANLKSFILTDDATKTEYTVKVNEKTTLVTSAGKKLKMSELKKGDGVGISHQGGLASKIVVNVRSE